MTALRVVIAHQTVSGGDAIGHDIMGMYETLRRNGFEVSVFAENYVDDAARLAAADPAWSRTVSADVLLYHHSIYWEKGERLIEEFKGKKIVKYHNVTPPIFFEPYCRLLADTTRNGRAQTLRLSRRSDVALFIGDSEFNSGELINCGADVERVKTVPPFHRIGDLDALKADRRLMELLSGNGRINVMFVGQTFPHKGHRHLLRTAHSFKKLFGDNILIWIVGKIHAELNNYMEELNEQIRRLSLSENIYFTDKLPAPALKSYFLSSALFLCMSEHEGFCVPAIEAQYFGLPVIAYNSSAVCETIGRDQISLSELDYDLFAGAIFTVTSDEEIRDFLITKGSENFASRFTTAAIEKRFMEEMKPIIGKDS